MFYHFGCLLFAFKFILGISSRESWLRNSCTFFGIMPNARTKKQQENKMFAKTIVKILSELK